MTRLTFPAVLAAVMMGGGALLNAAPAQAQIGVEIGPRGPRVYDDGPRYERRRRYEEDCRWEIRRRVNRYGEVVERRIRVCD